MNGIALPTVYTVFPGVSFARALAMELWREYQHDLLALSSVQIYLPNRRSTRELADMFLEISDGQSTLLPRLTPLGDIDEEDLLESDPFILEEDPFLRPAIPSLERQLLLSEMILRRQDIRLSPGDAFTLASELCRFIDRSHTEEVDLEGLRDLVTGDLAAHWEKTKDFLSIITENWPHILETRNQLDPAQRRTIIFEKKIEALRKNPPLHRVIAAGSTGSIPVAARLLEMIARLPQGCVVLPGLDVTMDDRTWDAIDDVHPFYYQKKLIEQMTIDRHTIQQWPGSDWLASACRGEKLKLANYAMQPQEVFDLSDATIQTDYLGDMDFIAAEDPFHEAKIIALRLRDVLNHEHQTAIVVTPDRLLAQFIQQEMLRWDVAVNDSGGVALNDTSIGMFLMLIAGICCTQCPATHLLSILRHPLFRLHPPLERRATEIDGLERALRANFLPKGGLKEFVLHYESPLLADSLQYLEPFADPSAILPLHQWIERHILCAESLASTPTVSGAETLWRLEAGEAAAQLLYKLHDAALNHSLEISAQDYTHFIAKAFSQVVVRPNFGTHPRLRILSPIEARLQDADVVILAGLNEGVWPAPIKADTWLSRPMQSAMGFSSPDRRLGQSALDFLLLFCMKNVVITWSKKRDGAVSHPSRWLQQIFAVLEKNGARPVENASPYYHWAHQWDKPAQLSPHPAPSYSPPLSIRPRRLPVTAIGTWQQDPYSLYARQILKLYPLESLDRHPDSRDWGTATHKILERFYNEYIFETADPQNAFDAIRQQVLMAYPLTPSLAKAWQGKLDAISDWVLANIHESSSRILTEKKMTMQFTLTDGSTFELNGKADRIDREVDQIIVTDYKTGSLPMDKSIVNGQSPQMPLLGLLAKQASGLSAPDIQLRYIKLKGKTGDPVTVKNLKNPEEIMQLNREYLSQLLEEYYIQETPYTASMIANASHDTYHNLKRVAEWASLEDDADESPEESA